MNVFNHPLGLIIRSAKDIERHIEQHVGHACHMNRSHARLLFILSMHSGLSQVQLREIIGISAPVMSRQIDAMVQMGYVSRTTDPDNRRLHTIGLTKKGDQISKKVATELQKSFNAIEGRTRAPLAKLTPILKQLLADIEHREKK